MKCQHCYAAAKKKKLKTFLGKVRQLGLIQGAILFQSTKDFPEVKYVEQNTRIQFRMQNKCL